MSETLYSFYRNNEEIKYNTDDPLGWVTGPRLRFNKCSPGVVLEINFEATETKFTFRGKLAMFRICLHCTTAIELNE